MRYACLALALIAAAGCRGPAEPVVENKTERVLRGCGEAGRLLEQMREAESRFDYDADGNARMPAELWQQLPPPMQEGLVKAIAYHAICEAGEIEERSVTIRNSESGEVLTQQIVTEFGR